MNILITGDKGFIGRHLTRSVIQDGHQVLGWDIVDKKDISDITSADLDNIDIIVHLAAIADVTNSQRNPNLYYDVNVEGTRTIFKAISNVPGGIPIIYASSSCAREWWRSPYGTTKKMTEVMGEEINRSVALRFSNVYGEGQRQTMLFPRMINGNISHVSKNHVRDFVHVDDVIDAIKIFLYSDDFTKFDKVYDVGTGVGHKVSDLVRRYGFNVTENLGNMCEMLDNTANIDKLTKLGWTPKNDLDKYLKGKLDGDTKFKKYIQRLLPTKLRFWRN